MEPQTIALANPRVTRGGVVVMGYARYLPVWRDSMLHNPPLYRSLLDVHCGHRKQTLHFLTERESDLRNSKIRHKLLSELMTNFGLSRSLAEVIAYHRSQTDIRRIELAAEAAVDMFVVAKPSVFGDEHDVKLLRRLIRWIFSVGAFSTNEVISQWKNFIQLLWTEATMSFSVAWDEEDMSFQRASLSSQLSWLKEMSVFKELVPLLKAGSKQGAELLAPFLSIRGFPCGSGKKIIEAQQTYIANVTQPFEEIVDLFSWGIMSGPKVYSRIPTSKLPKANEEISSHISINSSASAETSVSAGGRRAELFADFTSWCKYTASEDTVVKSVYTGLQYTMLAGVERWRTAFREKPILTGDFLAEDFVQYDVRGFRVGLDKSLTLQLLECAFTRADFYLRNKVAIPMKVVFLPEPGGKVRVVSTPPWWSIILQQVPSHVFIDLLRWIPEVEASMNGRDPSWGFMEYVRGYYWAEKLLPTNGVLSSDLKEATDHIPWSAARGLVSSFATQVFGTVPVWVQTALDLVTAPHCFSLGNQSYTTVRGIPMGEPMAKPILTLYSMAVCLNWTREKRERLFYLGGDDFLAVASFKDLEILFGLYKVAGAEPSLRKSTLSNALARFCERLLWLRGYFNHRSRSTAKEVIRFSDPSQYPFWLIVDQVKVRLLSPVTKTLLTQDESNCAIGKAYGLHTNLRWAMETRRPWDFVSIRNRFLYRMQQLLPKPHTKLWYQTFLPYDYGGLWFALSEEEAYFCLQNTISITRNAVYEMQSCDAIRREHLSRLMQAVYSNSSIRGLNVSTLREEDSMLEAERRELFENPNLFHQVLASHAKPELSMHMQDMTEFFETYLKPQGFIRTEELADKLTRIWVFSKMLTEKPNTKRFQTEKWRKRFFKLWANLEKYRVQAKPVPFSGPIDFCDKRTEDFYVVDMNQLVTYAAACDPETVGAASLPWYDGLWRPTTEVTTSLKEACAIQGSSFFVGVSAVGVHGVTL